MKKIMERRFMFVGTLEEAAFNKVVSPASTSFGITLISYHSSLDAIGIMAR